MSERPTEFVVQRSKWLRGNGEGSVLLDRHGCMCCLGFVANQCGMAADVLLDNATPACLRWDDDADMERIAGILAECTGVGAYGDDIWADSQLAVVAITLNDDAAISEAERETQLSALFAKHGYALRFEP